MTVTVSIVPTLIDALVSQAQAAMPNVDVVDGPDTFDMHQGDYLFVGVEDPDSDDFQDSADSTQDFATMRTSPSSRQEEGEIVCCASSWNGDANNKEARDAAYATASGVATMLRNDPKAGLGTTYPNIQWLRFGSSTSLSQLQDSDGATAQVVFRIAFAARI